MNAIQDLKLLIADDRIDDALQGLLTYVQDSDNDFFNQIVLLKSQYKDFTKRENLNLNESNIEKQKILSGLLNIVDEVGEKINAQKTDFKNTEKDQDTEGAIIKGSSPIMSVLWANIYGFEIKNADLVMMTMHPQSPLYEGFRDYIKQIFVYDIIYKVISMELYNHDEDEAEVKMVLESRSKMYDPSFKNNISISMQSLKRDKDGYWKIWTGEILELKYLEI
jgi:chitinase